MGKKRDHSTFSADNHGSPKTPSTAIQHLDLSHPSKTQHTPIPPYSTKYSSSTKATPPQSSNPSQSTTTIAPSLPPLPPLAPGNLSVAPFTHPSAAPSKYTHQGESQLNYERLEFLGDAYIEIIATRIIYSRFPNLLTGKQARLREAIVRNSTLAGYAEGYGFEGHIVGDRALLTEVEGGTDTNGRPQKRHTGPSEKTWEKTLADVFEAYVAAVVLSDLDGKGFCTAEKWLEELWAPLLIRPGDILSARGLTARLGAPVSVVPSPIAAKKEKAKHGKSEGSASANGVMGEDWDNPNTHWRDRLQKAIQNRDVRVEYRDEPFELPSDLHLKSKEEQFHTKQLMKVSIFVPRDPDKDEKELVKLGSGTGKGRKEASMLAARDALKKNSSTLQRLIARKVRRNDEKAREENGDCALSTWQPRVRCE